MKLTFASKPICFLLLTAFAILTVSCIDSEQNKVANNLTGEWVLDSISTPSGKIIANASYKEHNTLTFKNQTDYSYRWISSDVGNTFTGKYFILDNPKRGLLTLALIPDINISGKDTVRTEYMNFDINFLKNDRLVLIDETKWIARNTLPSLEFSTKYIYKKRK